MPPHRNGRNRLQRDGGIVRRREIRIGKACDALERFEKPNIARAARDFNVNERKLRNRFNGIPSKTEYGGHNKTLTDDQELAVCHYLDRMD